MSNIIENKEIITMNAADWIKLILFIDDNKKIDEKNGCYYIVNNTIRKWVDTTDNSLKITLESYEKILHFTKMFLEGERRTKRIQSTNENRLYFSESSILKHLRQTEKTKIKV